MSENAAENKMPSETADFAHGVAT